MKIYDLIYLDDIEITKCIDILKDEYLNNINVNIKANIILYLCKPKNNYKYHEICLNKEKIIKNNNILLYNYLKVNNINIENIEENLLVILNLLSEELSQAYNLLGEYIFISCKNSILLRACSSVSMIVLSYTSYLLFFYNLNNNFENKNKEIILDYIYYTIYNINKSMDVQINSMECFKNIKDKYNIDKLYCTNIYDFELKHFDNKYWFYNSNEIYYLLNYVFFKLDNIIIFEYPIVLNNANLKRYEYWCKYIISIFSKYRQNKKLCLLSVEINKKISELIDNNAQITKNIIKFVIIILSISTSCNNKKHCHKKYTMFLSYFYDFIKVHFNYKDLEEIINITNNIDNQHCAEYTDFLIYDTSLKFYHIILLRTISNFKELCKEFLTINIDITSKLVKTYKTNFTIHNNFFINTSNYYLLDTINEFDYIKTFYNLLKKNDNMDITKHILKHLHDFYDKNKYYSIILIEDFFYFVVDDTKLYPVYSISKYYDMFILAYNINYISLIKNILEETNLDSLYICTNTFTKMYHLLQDSTKLKDRHITIIHPYDFDTNFYNLNDDAQNLACANICFYYSKKSTIYCFCLQSAKFINYNGYNKVAKLFDSIINIMFKQNINQLIYCLLYIIYYLNIDYELLDCIIKKLYDENIFNTIDFKYTLVKFLKEKIIKGKNQNIIYLYPYYLYNSNVSDMNIKFNNVLLKIYKNSMFRDLFFNFKDVDDNIKIYFDF